MEVLERIGLTGLIPVVVIKDPADAVPAAKAILKSGIDVIEITMRTEAGLDSISRIREEVPEILVGAGTVLTIENLKAASSAGAQFVVTPGYNRHIVEWCIENNMPITPGCVTPTEIGTAIGQGLKVLKFFPADIYGGINACKSLYGPFGHTGLKFIPTGGINEKNLKEYADKQYIHAIGGGWLCSTEDLAAKNYDNITTTCERAIDILLGFEFAHMGINTSGESNAEELGTYFDKAFGLRTKKGNSSDFAGGEIELVKGKGLGENGHIAIRTNHIDRAMSYLKKKGYRIAKETIKLKNGLTTAVYLQDNVAGFAVHLLQK
jgi:2-dehydro-3-deoxyphosphogluconate aldolase/(4S)-4-hydroxy-2-oxoglutarate aldolase